MIPKKDRKPVVVTTNKRKIVTSWWAETWIKNLERYADFSNRLPRGRTYVRHGAVIHMEIKKGEVYALVQGSRRKPYEVNIAIDPIRDDKKEKLEKLFSENVSGIEDLIHGEFPMSLKEELFDPTYGLFPSDDEISVGCSCPDWAVMCKHVIATLYAVAIRLDENPLLFFELRGMDPKKLIQKGVNEKIRQLVEVGDTIDDERIIKDPKRIDDLFEI